MLIDIKQLAVKYNIKSKGVLHIGAHEGQEAETYAALGMGKMIFIEANPSVYTKLLGVIKGYPKARAINACVSDEERDVQFHIASNDGQSSSILELGTHKELHPEVTYVDHLKLKTQRMDAILKKKDWEELDFLNIDIQGMELPALKSMGDKLKKFKYVYLEVNRGQVYEGCAEIDEVDAFLKEFGFIRKETEWVNQWGDAFYIKQHLEVLPNTTFDPLDNVQELEANPPKLVKETGMIVQVEQHFLPVIEGAGDFERWFGANIESKELANRLYIPIQWSAYYTFNDRGRNQDALGHVQYALDNLNKEAKYFTIVQWHEGIINYFHGKDIKVFGPAGIPNVDHVIDLSKNPEEIKAFILEKVNN